MRLLMLNEYEFSLSRYVKTVLGKTQIDAGSPGSFVHYGFPQPACEITEIKLEVERNVDRNEKTVADRRPREFRF